MYKYCQHNGFTNIRLKIDSMCLRHMIMRTWKIPWEVGDIIEEIDEIINGSNTHIEHVFRETNQLADYITNATFN